MSDSLRPHESQHTRPPCPSPTPRVHSDSRALSQWCHPAISSSVIPFSSCPQSLPASESFPMSQRQLKTAFALLTSTTLLLTYCVCVCGVTCSVLPIHLQCSKADGYSFGVRKVGVWILFLLLTSLETSVKWVKVDLTYEVSVPHLWAYRYIASGCDFKASTRNLWTVVFHNT